MAAAKKRVLIVDDNTVIQGVLREFLSHDYAVDTATNATQAVAALIQHHPNVILLDIKMPGLDGLSLLRALRSTGVATPIVVMTGYDSNEVAGQALRNGADAYLAKPFDLQHLARLIAEGMTGTLSRNREHVASAVR